MTIDIFDGIDDVDTFNAIDNVDTINSIEIINSIDSSKVIDVHKKKKRIDGYVCLVETLKKLFKRKLGPLPDTLQAGACIFPPFQIS